jgi:hypothetical protein
VASATLLAVIYSVSVNLWSPGIIAILATDSIWCALCQQRSGGPSSLIGDDFAWDIVKTAWSYKQLSGIRGLARCSKVLTEDVISKGKETRGKEKINSSGEKKKVGRDKSNNNSTSPRQFS